MNRRGFLKGLLAGIAGAVVGVKGEPVAAEEEHVGGYVTLPVDYSYGAGCIYPPSIVDKFRTYPECVGDIRIEYDEPVDVPYASIESVFDEYITDIGRQMGYLNRLTLERDLRRMCIAHRSYN